MRCAIIAAGTNSCRLLIADKDGSSWRPAYHELRGTRLGEGMSTSRQLQPTAIERTLVAVAAFAQLAQAADVRFGIGTSALREATNAREFSKQFADVTDTPLEILSGEEEARASFAGACLGLKSSTAAHDGDMCVVDVGGGSTELAAGAMDAEPGEIMSLKLGAVTLTETTFKADPPSAAELERAAMTARLSLERAGPLVGCTATLVMAGGTADTAARMLRAYDPPDSHVGLVHRDELEELTKLVASLPLAQRKMLRGLEQERADIFPAGTIILSEVLRVAKKERAYVTLADLLLGYIARHAP